MQNVAVEKDSIPWFQLDAVLLQYFFALQQQNDKF